MQFVSQFTFDLEENSFPKEYNAKDFGLDLGAAYEFTQKLFVEGSYSFQVNNNLKNAPSGYSLRGNYLNLGCKF